jgi:hypothetical protein
MILGQKPPLSGFQVVRELIDDFCFWVGYVELFSRSFDTFFDYD